MSLAPIAPIPVRVPQVDLRPQHAEIEAELRAAFEAFLASPRFILGETVERFEASFAEFLGIEHAVAVSSGSDALLCSLLALGIEPGDEVITTPFTFVATAEAIQRLGAVPRFVDIDPISLNLDPRQIERSLSKRSRAIVPVHLFGEPAQLDPILAIARQQGLAVIEDAAQALGAEYHQRPAGTLGTLGCFSFFPSKPLGGWGDGGMVVTRDDDLAERCRALRSHGRDRAGQYRYTGGNFRLDALQAALLDVKLSRLPQWIAERRALAARYDERLRALPKITIPQVSAQNKSVYAQYTLRVSKARDGLAKHLRAQGVETAVHYRTPLHLEPAFARLGLSVGDFPEAERAASEVLSLPMYVGLSREQQNIVLESIEEFSLG